MKPAHKPEGWAVPGLGWKNANLVFAELVVVAAVAIAYRNLCLCQNPPARPMRIVPLTTYSGFQGNARFSPDGNQIAFTWFGDPDYNEDIYAKQIGAERPLRLTTDPAKDESPTWSPDGRYIAFRRRGDGKDGIYVVPGLGGPERKVLASKDDLSDDSSLDWSPDGKWLAYVDRGLRQSEAIFLIAVDNPKDRRPLTTSIGQRDYYPHFSPDGRTVAFVRFADTRDIFLVRVAGGEPKRLTFDDAIIWGLDWTPDGAHIIFVSDRLGGKPRLWKVSTSGGQPELLSMPRPTLTNPRSPAMAAVWRTRSGNLTRTSGGMRSPQQQSRAHHLQS